MNRTQGLTRRAALLGLGASAAAVALPWAARAQNPGDRRYLLVVPGTGGASIIDAMLAIREGEHRGADRDGREEEHGSAARSAGVAIAPGSPGVRSRGM